VGCAHPVPTEDVKQTCWMYADQNSRNNNTKCMYAYDCMVCQMSRRVSIILEYCLTELLLNFANVRYVRERVAFSSSADFGRRAVLKRSGWISEVALERRFARTGARNEVPWPYTCEKCPRVINRDGPIHLASIRCFTDPVEMVTDVFMSVTRSINLHETPVIDTGSYNFTCDQLHLLEYR